MSQASLAGKYRPQTFAEVVGQEMVKQILSRASLEDRVAPAYLFSGTRGVGKTTVARIFAKALNCAQAPTTEPCNLCPACRRITQGSFVDVVEVDGASNRGIDDIRRLREAVGYASLEGRYKVFIIDEAHMLTKEAFNALLKTLEEPPARVSFVMATTEPHKFPATIISRCQHFVFRQIPEARLEEHITQVLQKEGRGGDSSVPRLIARRAAGSVRDAMSLLGQALALRPAGEGVPLEAEEVRSVLGLAGQEVLDELFQALRNRDSAAIVQLTRGLLGQGVDLGFFLRELSARWRNLFLLRQLGESHSAAQLPAAASALLPDANEQECKALLAQAGQFPLAYIHAAWQMTLDGQRRILTSLDPAAGLELLLLNLALLPRLLPLRELGGLPEAGQAGPGGSGLGEPEPDPRPAPNLDQAPATPKFPASPSAPYSAAQSQNQAQNQGQRQQEEQPKQDQAQENWVYEDQAGEEEAEQWGQEHQRDREDQENQGNQAEQRGQREQAQPFAHPAPESFASSPDAQVQSNKEEVQAAASGRSYAPRPPASRTKAFNFRPGAKEESQIPPETAPKAANSTTEAQPLSGPAFGSESRGDDFKAQEQPSSFNYQPSAKAQAASAAGNSGPETAAPVDSRLQEAQGLSPESSGQQAARSPEASNGSAQAADQSAFSGQTKARTAEKADPGPETIEKALDWADFLRFNREEAPEQLPNLGALRGRWKGDKLELRPDSLILYQQLESGPLRDKLAQNLASWLGEQAELEILPPTQVFRSESEVRAEVENHPLILTLQREFDAMILHCIDLEQNRDNPD